MSRKGHPRRTVLAAGVGVTITLAGCGRRDDAAPPHPPPGPDPLQPVLDEALALAALFDRAALAQPGLASRLTPLAADHRAHAAELTRIIGPSARTIGPSAPSIGTSAASIGTSPAPSAGAAAPAVDDLPGLRAAEQAAQRNAAAACRQAPADRAAVLGSIAACRATHAEALR